jgi:quercetin dioxygenase-like cupin family protein
MSENKLIAKIFNYEELIAYQEGSIVSRIIIDKDIGTVTVFAFAEGQKLSTHSAPYDALLQVVDGTGTFIINDKEFILNAPAAIIMPANEPHSVHSDESFKMVLTMIKEK